MEGKAANRRAAQQKQVEHSEEETSYWRNLKQVVHFLMHLEHPKWEGGLV
jgi:hypothetical protein